MHIVRIAYDYSHGSMYGMDFNIDASADCVHSAFYFGKAQNPKEKANGKISKKRWNRLLDAVEQLLPSLKPVARQDESDAEYYALDEGNESLTITFSENGTETRTAYTCPHSEAFEAFTDILRKIAEKA